MIKRVLLLILAGVLLCSLSGIMGCGTQPITLIDLVPQDVSFVVGIEVSKILADEDIEEAYNEAEKPAEWPQTFDDALAWIEDETGIDLSDFTNVLVFGDIGSDYLSAIIKGAFDREALIDSVERAIGEKMAISTYRGYQIYTATVQDEAGAICFLGDDTVVVGPTDVVEDVIDVREGAPHLGGVVYEIYNSLGDVWIKGAIDVPEETMGDISEWELPIGLETFEDIEAAGFGFNKSGQNLSLQIKLYFSDAESASDAEQMISGITAFIPLMMPEMPTGVLDLLDGLSISRSGSWLTITLETTVTEIEELIGEMPPGSFP